MHNNDLTTVPHEKGEPHMPLDAVERLLQQKLRDNIAPYGLEVDCAALQLWAQQWDEPGFRHQNLVRELRVWSPILARKPLARIYFNDPFRLVDAPALTEVVYGMGQNLKLLHGHHVEHGATLNHHDLTRLNLGLLKGLDFNHICLKINAGFDLQELRVHRQMLADFRFAHFSLELNFDAAEHDFLLHLMELMSFIEPASICFGGDFQSPFAKVDREGLTTLLMQFGYFLTDSGTLLKHQSPLQKRPRDTLRLGPGGRSRFAALQATNLAAPDQFGARLDSAQLPVAICF